MHCNKVIFFHLTKCIFINSFVAFTEKLSFTKGFISTYSTSQNRTALDQGLKIKPLGSLQILQVSSDVKMLRW